MGLVGVEVDAILRDPGVAVWGRRGSRPEDLTPAEEAVTHLTCAAWSCVRTQARATIPLKMSRVSVFFSYSHKDEILRDELAAHLSLLERTGVIQSWHDRRIGAGEDWKNSIDKNLERADIILLLVSSDFIASDYCYEIEMKRSIERHDAGKCVVIPVILRKCKWDIAPFARYLALPRDGKPVTSWPNRDEAWTEVVTGIQRAVSQINNP